MKVKRIFAKNNREAMKIVREELGKDAVIFSNKYKNNGVEIIAGLEVESTLLNSRAEKNPQINNSKSPTQNNLKEKKNISYKNENILDLETSADRVLNSLKSEIASLRGLLSEQLSKLIWDQGEIKSPIHAAITRKLADCNLSSKLINTIVSRISSTTDHDEAWNKTKEIFCNSINVVLEPLPELYGIYNFIGPTGSGKTMTIAKIASQYALANGNKDIALISTDDKRIAAYEQLAKYSKILNIEIFNIEDDKSLQNIIDLNRNKKLILIDTPGVNFKNTDYNSMFMPFNEMSCKIKNYLILPVNINYNYGKELIDFYKNIGIYACILTKVDEVSSLGIIASLIIENQLPVHFFADGQGIPDNLKNISQYLIAQKTFIVKNNAEKKTNQDLVRFITKDAVDG